MIPDHQDTSEDIPTEFVLPGLPLLSKTLFSGGNGPGATSHGAEKLGKDLALYERKAAEFMDKMMAEARSREETKLAVKDPLKFWFSQVRYGNVTVTKNYCLQNRRVLESFGLSFRGLLKTSSLSRQPQFPVRGSSPSVGS